MTESKCMGQELTHILDHEHVHAKYSQKTLGWLVMFARYMND